MVIADVRYSPRFGVVIALGLLATAGFAGTGCAVVGAHQREHLAKRAMTDDRAPGEARFNGHERGSREGAEGGTGQPGGGCGCN